ncbi:MAG: adaptor protein MecA [Candidatus Howiella sp.]
MDIHLEGDCSLIINLNYRDLSELGFTYHTLSYNSERSRAAIQSLLRDAAARTGFHYSGGRLMIEAFPAPGMGCTLLFTNLEEKPQQSRRFRQKETPPQIFEFPSAEEMMAAMRLAFAEHLPEGRLYLLGKRYRLVTAGSGRKTQALLSEYGKPLGRSDALSAYTAEHGDLISSAAVKQIGGSIARRETEF